MAATRSLLLVSVVSCFLICSSHGFSLFSELNKTLQVTASPTPGQVLKAGEDNITVTWGLDKSAPAGADSTYKTIKVKLCYAPISQKDRAWRKTEEHLNKDKTCQHKVVARPYNKTNQTFQWTVQRDVPGATYFVRAYAYDANDHEAAYGQTSDDRKTTNLFVIQPITGRHASLDIASICFSVFSIVALFGFFYNEKRKSKNAQEK